MNLPKIFESKKGLDLGSFLRLDLSILVIMLVLPYLFFPEIGFKVMLITLAVLFSRATSLYDNLKVEFHSLLVIALVYTYGAGPGIYVALMSAPLQNKLGQTLGSFQKPPWILIDCLELVALSIIVPFIPGRDLFFYGMVLIILVNNFLIGAVRVFFFNDAISRRIPLSMVNIMINYLLLQHFLERVLAFMK